MAEHALNLLPWRLLKKRSEKQAFRRWMVWCVGMGCGLLLTVYCHVNCLLTDREEALVYLHRELQRDQNALREVRTIRKENHDLMIHMRLLHDWLCMRLSLLQALHALRSMISDDMYFTRFDVVKNKVTIMGVSTSEQSVAMLMQQIENHPYMSQPNLIEMKRTDEQTTAIFQIMLFLNSQACQVSHV